MKRLLLLFAAAASAMLAADAPAPAVNWVLPLFTDQEGFHAMTLRGSAVRPGEKSSITVTDLSITVFSGDAAAHVESVLLSPIANFYPKQNLAGGSGTVRLIRDDIEVNGTDWTYDHAAKKVSLHQHVKVTFSAQLNDILK
jgi:hypothetical protein